MEIDPRQQADSGVSSTSGTSDASGTVTGYTIVEAEDLDAAVEIAQRNPIVAGDNGSVDVISIIEMG